MNLTYLKNQRYKLFKCGPHISRKGLFEVNLHIANVYYSKLAPLYYYNEDIHGKLNDQCEYIYYVVYEPKNKFYVKTKPTEIMRLFYS